MYPCEQKSPDRIGLGFRGIAGECPPPFSESVETRFLAGDLADQEFPESQLRDSTGLCTGFAFKPSNLGGHQKALFYFLYCIAWQASRQAISVVLSHFSISRNANVCA